MELSRSMAASLELPQYVAYQKNVVYAFIKLSAKSHSFNILCTIDVLSCPSTKSFFFSLTDIGRIPFDKFIKEIAPKIRKENAGQELTLEAFRVFDKKGNGLIR